MSGNTGRFGFRLAHHLRTSDRFSAAGSQSQLLAREECIGARPQGVDWFPAFRLSLLSVGAIPPLLVLAGLLAAALFGAAPCERCEHPKMLVSP